MNTAIRIQPAFIETAEFKPGPPIRGKRPVRRESEAIFGQHNIRPRWHIVGGHVNPILRSQFAEHFALENSP